MLRFDAAILGLGLSLEAAPGQWVRIYEPTRTVVELMRLRGRFGGPLAHAALQRYLHRRDARPAEVLQFASKLDAYGPVRRALEVAMAQ